MWLNLLEMIGFKGPAENLRQLLTNRHLALENYQFESIRAISSNRNLEIALSNFLEDQKYSVFAPTYSRQIIALEAHTRAAQVDALLNHALPSLYVSDPSYKFSGTDPSVNLAEISLLHDKTAAAKLEQEFLVLMGAFGSHTRNTVRYVLPKK